MDWRDTRHDSPKENGNYIVRYYKVSFVDGSISHHTMTGRWYKDDWFTIGHYFTHDVLGRKGKVTHFMPTPLCPNDYTL